MSARMGLREVYVSLRARLLRRRKLRWFLLQGRRWMLSIWDRVATLSTLCLSSCAPGISVAMASDKYSSVDGGGGDDDDGGGGGGRPVARPLTSLAQLKDRTLFASPDFEFLKSSVALDRASSVFSKRPRLLVCHDYRAGYQEDKWVQGQAGMEGYLLWHWHLVDVFVYFSHSLVTLPPPGWINAAHKHGVPVLGTFITEWALGASVCRSLLSDAETSRMYASRLADLAQALGFDGWLINIENAVDMKDLPRLHVFVQHLRHYMHALLPHSLVVWYDAVTEEGKLDWQNCLNEKNRFFFGDSDGLFTNYAWTEGMAKLSADAAGERASDVYMGVDVFGRNTFGGGGFNCDIALKVSQKAEVSAALFAPGWVYETNQPPSFEVAQTRWWGTIEQCWPAARFSPTKLPFFSDFNRGNGSRTSVEGEEVSTQPWFNLSCQNLQPMLRIIAKTQHMPQPNPLQVSISHEAAYSGGSCLQISGSDSLGLIQLYEAHVPVAGIPLHIAHSVLLGNQLQVCLALRICKEDSWFLVVLLEEGEEVQMALPSQQLVVRWPTHDAESSSILSERRKWTIRNHILDFGTYVLNQIYAVTYACKLDGTLLLSLIEENIGINYSMAALPDAVEVEGKDDLYSSLIGHIRLAKSVEHDSVLPSIIFEGCYPEWTQAADGQKSVSLTLRWGLDIRDGKQGDCRWVQYYVFIMKKHLYPGVVDSDKGHEHKLMRNFEFLGVAVVQAFRVHDLLVSSTCSKIDFCVQTQCACGISGMLKTSAVCSVEISASAHKNWTLDSDPSQPRSCSKIENAV